jgi:ABC-2 type transport system permease protein
MCAAAALLNGVRLPVDEWLAVIALLCFGAAPFVLLGLGIGYLCTAQTVQPANFLAYFGLSILGGLWLPLKIFPQWIQTLGAYTPTHGYADLSWRVVFHDPARRLTAGAGLQPTVGRRRAQPLAPQRRDDGRRLDNTRASRVARGGRQASWSVRHFSYAATAVGRVG